MSGADGRVVFSREALEQFSQWASDRAEDKAASMYPPGRKREDCVSELRTRYYAEYVTPPPCAMVPIWQLQSAQQAHAALLVALEGLLKSWDMLLLPTPDLIDEIKRTLAATHGKES